MDVLFCVSIVLNLVLLVVMLIYKEKAEEAEIMAEEMEIRAARAEVQNDKLRRIQR